MKERNTEQLIRLRELELEKKRIVSGRIYLSLWLVISLLLISTGMYGFAIGNQDLGLNGMIWGLVLGLIGHINMYFYDS